MLLALAVAHTGDTGIASEPNAMMRVANAYALVGLPRLIGILGDRGGDVALDYLSEFVEQACAPTRHPN